MNLLLKLSALSFMTLVLSCNSTNSITDDTKNNIVSKSQSSNQLKEIDSKMKTEGYSSGTVMYLKDSKCPYIIIDEKSGVKFDPINFDSKKNSAFKNDNEKIYFKYRGLRMANRCNEAQPIEIEDIKKREE